MKLAILVVDNNREYLDSLAEFLSLAGCPSQKAYSLKEALELLSTTDFEACLVDLHLARDGDEGDRTGFEVAKRADEKNIPCIIMTALASVDSTREALTGMSKKPLAVDFVEKKHGPQAILQAIRRLQGMTILHLSDIHFQRATKGEPFDQERAYNEFLKDVRNQPSLLLHPFEAIVVSGDISYQNEPESFNKAEKFLKTLARDLKVPRKRIVLTPGNHDIERQKASSLGDSLKAMRVNDPSWFSKFDAFLGFTRRFYGRPMFTPKKLYSSINLDGRVSIVAFNSCLVEGDADWRCRRCRKEHYPGWINREQVDRAGEELSRRGWNGFRIGVFHHHVLPGAPRSRANTCWGEDLINYFDPQQRLEHVFSEKDFRILLHGHWHKVGLHRSNVVGNNAPLRFGSGAFWTTSSRKDESANYLLLQLSPRQNRSRILMRRYAPSTEQRTGFWSADDSIKPDGMIALPEDIIIPTLADRPDGTWRR